MLGHCRLTNIPAEYSICDLFAKLVAAHATNHTQNVVKHLRQKFATKENKYRLLKNRIYEKINFDFDISIVHLNSFCD